MSEEKKEEEFEIEEVDLLRLQYATEKQQRLQYTIKELYEGLMEAQKKAQAAKTEFEKKYTEDGKYSIISVDDSKYVGKRVLADQEDSEAVEEPEVFVDVEESAEDE